MSAAARLEQLLQRIEHEVRAHRRGRPLSQCVGKEANVEACSAPAYVITTTPARGRCPLHHRLHQPRHVALCGSESLAQ